MSSYLILSLSLHHHKEIQGKKKWLESFQLDPSFEYIKKKSLVGSVVNLDKTFLPEHHNCHFPKQRNETLPKQLNHL